MMEIIFKRALVALFAFIALMLSTFAFAKSDANLPHYFPAGLSTMTKPSDQWALLFETLKASSLCQSAPEQSGQMMNIRTIKETHVVYGEKVKFHFDLWTREPDGKIYYTDYCGRKQITEAQFAVVRNDWLAYYKGGVKGAFESQKHIESDIIAAAAKVEKKSDADMRASLGKAVPELAHLSPPVTFREFLRIPEGPFTEKDFVQKEVHIVHAQYWGMVIIDTEMVFLTPQGRIIDHLIGKPTVAVHELTHGNQKIQSLLDGLEHEYMASIPMLLIPEDKFFFWFHPYVKEMREISEVLFGFNWKQARKEIFTNEHDGVNLRIDEAALNKHAAEIDRIKEALTAHYKSALPEVYQHRLFWSSLNNKLGDNHAMWRILAVRDFDLTGLGGHANTAEWTSTRDPEIKEMADKAYKASGGTSEDKGEKSDRKNRGASSLLLLMKMTGLNEEKLRQLVKKYNLDITKLAKASDVEALDMILPVLRAERAALLPFEGVSK